MLLTCSRKGREQSKTQHFTNKRGITMTKTTISILCVLAFMTVSSVNADVLTQGKANDSQLIVNLVNGALADEVAVAKNAYSGGMFAKDSNADVFRVFCVDADTPLSSKFYGEGESYTAEALTDTFLYTETQKSQLHSLFDHLYATVFAADGSMKDPVYGSLFQLAVWEIVHETSGILNVNGFSTDKGNFYVSTAYEVISGTSWWNNVVSTETTESYLETVNSWLNAANDEAGSLWSDLGYENRNVRLDIYVPEDGVSASQTLIRASYNDAQTPEPATMLIIGLGIAGLGLAKRRK
jgi:hypothetical protein